jgi:3-isopropylmalate/(R)-2-methylmalate dehydratase small subunit
MLPIRLEEAAIEDLFQRAKQPGYQLTADLEKCTITDAQGLNLKFDVEPFRRHCLLNGLDDIALTLEHEDRISAYETSRGMAPLAR